MLHLSVFRHVCVPYCRSTCIARTVVNVSNGIIFSQAGASAALILLQLWILFSCHWSVMIQHNDLAGGLQSGVRENYRRHSEDLLVLDRSRLLVTSSALCQVRRRNIPDLMACSGLFDAIGAGPKLCPKHQARLKSRVMSPSKIKRANVRGRAIIEPPPETHATWNVRDPRIVSFSDQAIDRGTNYNPGKFMPCSMVVDNGSIRTKGKSSGHRKPHHISKTRVDRKQRSNMFIVYSICLRTFISRSLFPTRRKK